MVGEPGFEPGTPWPPAKCATGLRYSPNQRPIVGPRPPGHRIRGKGTGVDRRDARAGSEPGQGRRCQGAFSRSATEEVRKMTVMGLEVQAPAGPPFQAPKPARSWRPPTETSGWGGRGTTSQRARWGTTTPWSSPSAPGPRPAACGDPPVSTMLSCRWRVVASLEAAAPPGSRSWPPAPAPVGADGPASGRGPAAQAPDTDARGRRQSTFSSRMGRRR